MQTRPRRVFAFWRGFITRMGDDAASVCAAKCNGQIVFTFLGDGTFLVVDRGDHAAIRPDRAGWSGAPTRHDGPGHRLYGEGTTWAWTD